MSMISDQCDKLRDLACELRKLANGPVNEGFPARANLFDSADAMCQAADTIWKLRNKLADMVDQREEIERLKAENAKLRAERDEWHRVAVSKQDIIDHMRDARAENAKLRELAHLVAEYTSVDQCEGCVTKRACNAGELDMCWIRKTIFEKLRELGVEVDG